MSAGNDFDPGPGETAIFSALLTPHRSLDRTGFLVVMTVVIAVSFAAGVAFLIMGAWPVVSFFGLDALAVTAAEGFFAAGLTGTAWTTTVFGGAA